LTSRLLPVTHDQPDAKACGGEIGKEDLPTRGAEVGGANIGPEYRPSLAAIIMGGGYGNGSFLSLDENISGL
jgi:hypothetical protein